MNSTFNSSFVNASMDILCDLKGQYLNHDHVAHVYEYMGASLEIIWFSCPDRTLKIMSQIKFDFLNQLIAQSAISLKIKYESQIKSLRKS